MLFFHITVVNQAPLMLRGGLYRQKWKHFLLVSKDQNDRKFKNVELRKEEIFPGHNTAGRNLKTTGVFGYHIFNNIILLETTNAILRM